MPVAGVNSGPSVVTTPLEVSSPDKNNVTKNLKTAANVNQQTVTVVAFGPSRSGDALKNISGVSVVGSPGGTVTVTVTGNSIIDGQQVTEQNHTKLIAQTGIGQDSSGKLKPEFSGS